MNRVTQERRLKWLLATAAAATGVSGAFAVFVRWALERVYVSIPICPPTRRQLEEEDLDGNPLYRAVPALRGRFAYRQLGDFPTPVHRFTARCEGQEIAFWVKREDLSSPLYGGNKVRTLQYLLASCEALVEQSHADAKKAFYAIGTGGSNQVVATKVHAAAVGLPKDCVTGFVFKDAREMDNTLNFLSSLSLPGSQELYNKGGLKLLSALLGSASPGTHRPRVLPPGGNNAVGVLGQLTGAMELAQQIENGEVPDPDAIVVALGSMCTVTGLVLGVALARELGIPAFRRPGFRIHAQLVHPALMMGLRLFRFHTSLSFPLSIGRGVKEIAAAFTACGGPDIFDAAVRVMEEEVVISYDRAIVGKYGAHSRASRDAKTFYDALVQPPPGEKGLWLCGHFTAKSFALLLRLLKEEQTSGHSKKHFLFWQTKSLVQPLGPKDEWEAFQEQCTSSSALEQWAVVGGGTGHPDSFGSAESDQCLLEGPEQYRSLMAPSLYSVS